MHEIIPNIFKKPKFWDPKPALSVSLPYVFSTSSTTLSPYNLRVYDKDNIYWFQPSSNPTYLGSGVLNTDTGAFTGGSLVSVGSLGSGGEHNRCISNRRTFVFNPWSSFQGTYALAVLNTETKANYGLLKTSVPQTLNQAKSWCSPDGDLALVLSTGYGFWAKNSGAALTFAAGSNISLRNVTLSGVSTDCKTAVFSDASNFFIMKYDEETNSVELKTLFPNTYATNPVSRCSNDGKFIVVTSHRLVDIFMEVDGEYVLVNSYNFPSLGETSNIPDVRADVSHDGMRLALVSGMTHVSVIDRVRSGNFYFSEWIPTGFSPNSNGFMTPSISLDKTIVGFSVSGSRPGNSIFIY